VGFLKLGDLDRLADRDVVEHLGRIARRPKDFERFDFGRLAGADGLFEGVGAETAAARDETVNGLVLFAGQDGFDPRADAGPIALFANEFDSERVVSLTRIPEEHVAEAISGGGAAELLEEVQVTVAVPVGEADGVALLQMTGAAGPGDVGEALAADVL